MNGAAISWFWHASSRIIKGMISRRQLVGIIPHQVGHYDPDAVFLVVQHDRRTACGTSAQLQRPIRVLGIEGLSIQFGRLVHCQIIVLKKHDVSCRLPGYGLANRAMAGVVVYRIMVRMGAPFRFSLTRCVRPLQMVG